VSSTAQPPAQTAGDDPPEVESSSDDGGVTPDADEPADRTTHVEEYETRHWRGIGALTIALLGAGMVLEEPAVALTAVVGATLAGYVSLTGPASVSGGADESQTESEPAGTDSGLTIDRTFADDSPDPGEEVAVTVTVTNRTDSLLTDVRIADGVPAEVEVVDGTPRHSDVFGPGGGSSFRYTVTVPRGEFTWNPATVVVADPSGAVEREVCVESDATLECSLPPLTDPERQLPLRALTTLYPGRIGTENGGPGLEFYATREYRPTDPLSRVDWKRMARTGDLGTLEFREERMARVMIVTDARREAYLAPDDSGEHAVDRSVTAAHRIFAGLLDSGNAVGIAGFGPIDRECWLTPGAGDGHRARGRDLLSTHEAFAQRPPDRELYERFDEERRETLQRRRIDRLHERLLPDTQVVLLSPCCDDYVPMVARRLEALDRPVTILSPDPTTEHRPEETLARIERTDRIAGLRSRGVRVVDWPADQSLVETLATITEGRS